jgi:hypothetical protein
MITKNAGMLRDKDLLQEMAKKKPLLDKDLMLGYKKHFPNS